MLDDALFAAVHESSGPLSQPRINASKRSSGFWYEGGLRAPISWSDRALLGFRGAQLLSDDRVGHQSNEFIRRSRIEPTHDGDDATIRIDPSTIAARPDCEEALGRRVRIVAAVRIEPPEITIGWVNWAWMFGTMDPML